MERRGQRAGQQIVKLNGLILKADLGRDLQDQVKPNHLNDTAVALEVLPLPQPSKFSKPVEQMTR